MSCGIWAVFRAGVGVCALSRAPLGASFQFKYPYDTYDRRRFYKVLPDRVETRGSWRGDATAVFRTSGAPDVRLPLSGSAEGRGTPNRGRFRVCGTLQAQRSFAFHVTSVYLRCGNRLQSKPVVRRGMTPGSLCTLWNRCGGSARWS
jgi:hypothetical protein